MTMQVVELGTEQMQQATFSIYHQNCTITFEDKCHHILTEVGISNKTVMHNVVAYTETTEQKEIFPRPFPDTKEASDRTRFAATVLTANKHELKTNFVGRSDQCWKCRIATATLLGENLRMLRLAESYRPCCGGWWWTNFFELSTVGYIDDMTIVIGGNFPNCNMCYSTAVM
jgi:hypothetical protein